MFMGDLHALPCEVLERIAFEATVADRGPPVGLVPLLLTSRTVYERLMASGLLAQLFYASFDHGAAVRRFGMLERSTARAELVKRFQALQRVRVQLWNADDLWTLFLMALENDGRNAQQLAWARAIECLERTADISSAPRETLASSLALHIRAIMPGSDRGTLQMAFGAHAYSILFSEMSPVKMLARSLVSCYGKQLELAAPPAALGAISLFCDAQSKLVGMPSRAPAQKSEAYDTDFARLFHCRVPSAAGLTPDAYSGVLEGVWEGTFFFLDFDAYREMLEGSAVNAIYSGQRQLVRLRETEHSSRFIKLAGAGHSAWGRFTVDGSVNTWDGLVTVNKSYTNRPAAWLYRGYVIGHDRIVGRWRDTTPGAHTGYEGPFLLTRR